jgi:hypothetical protein
MKEHRALMWFERGKWVTAISAPLGALAIYLPVENRINNENLS